MEPIRFENLYDLLAIELDRPVDRVRQGVVTDPEGLAEDADKAFAANKCRFPLLEPLTTPDGSMTLLASGSDLDKKVGSVITRQAKHPENPIGPVIFAPNDELVGHFRQMIMARLTPAMDEMKSNPHPALHRIFGAFKPAQVEAFSSAIERAVAGTMSSAAALLSMLQVAKSEGLDPRWKHSIQSAYTAMAIMSSLSELTTDKEVRLSVENLGSAALFQDVAAMLKPALYGKDTQRHPLRSAQLAETIGLSRAVQELIENHHKIMGLKSEGEEVATPADLTQEAKVLVVANLFVSAVNEPGRTGGDIEAIKGLNFMISEGKVDKRAVVTLTRLYLSHKFALFFEKAMEISKRCYYEGQADPILWNILGERNPQKFICSYTECAHLGSQQTLVSQTIPVKFDGQVVAKIKKGEYNNCRFLTGELANLYKEIAGLSTK